MKKCIWKHEYNGDGHSTYANGDFRYMHWKCECGAKTKTRLNEPLDKSGWLQKLCIVFALVFVCFLPTIIMILNS